MRHGAVRHDDEVKLFHNGGGIGEILQVRAERDDRPLPAAINEVLLARAFLQAVKLYMRKARQRQEVRGSDGTVLIIDII